MNSEDTPRHTSVAASAPPLAADDPRLTPEAIEHRRVNRLVERGQNGRLLKGSQLPNKGRKDGPMVTTLARQYTESAINLLGNMVEDEKAPPAARVAAAQALLDRGWGKAPIQIDVSVRAKFDDFLRCLTVSFGSFTVKNVDVAIMPNMDGDALLGMNVLKAFKLERSQGILRISL